MGSKCQRFLYCLRRQASLFIFFGLFSKAAISDCLQDAALVTLTALPDVSSRPPEAGDRGKPRGSGQVEVTGQRHGLVAHSHGPRAGVTSSF